jgi:hypothetical protein
VGWHVRLDMKHFSRKEESPMLNYNNTFLKFAYAFKQVSGISELCSVILRKRSQNMEMWKS